jgi:CBS domain-containing protein
VQPPEFTERRPPPDPVDHDEVAGRHGAAEGARAPAAAGAELAGARPGLTAPVGSLITRPPLFVEPNATVAGAAREMRLAGAGAALVAGEPRGIVTDRDLRNRVVAEELATSAPVRSVMSHPVRTLPADASIEEALLLMLDADIHHVPLARDGRIVGIVTDKDLLRHQARGPLLLLERIKSLARLEALEGYALEIAATAGTLLADDVDPVRIARVIASLNGTLTGKLLRLAEAELGPPPCPYAWLALGSEGRMEQVAATDQDNALAYRDDRPETRAYFETLAERTVAGLLEAGFPPCPGGYMATRWTHPLARWESSFRQWVDVPDPQALLEAEVFLDFRRVHGELSLEPLERVLLAGAGREMFLFHLARAAQRFAPPLGPLGRVRHQAGEVDLKRGGIAAIVLIARLSGLAARSPARTTLERLDAAAAAATLGRGTAEALGDAFRLLMRLRLREQLRSLGEGREPGNGIRLESLSALELRRLKEAFRAVREAQKAVALRYRAYPGA